jgi:hypothetical protein
VAGSLILQVVPRSFPGKVVHEFSEFITGTAVEDPPRKGSVGSGPVGITI